MCEKSGNLPGLVRVKRRFGAVANSAQSFSHRCRTTPKDLGTAHREFVGAFSRALQSALMFRPLCSAGRQQTTGETSCAHCLTMPHAPGTMQTGSIGATC